MGLEQVELIMDVEDEFGISIESQDDYGQSAATVGELYDLVLRLTCRRHQFSSALEGDSAEGIWKRVAILVAKHSSGLKPENITRETRFIEDLGYG